MTHRGYKEMICCDWILGLVSWPCHHLPFSRMRCDGINNWRTIPFTLDLKIAELLAKVFRRQQPAARHDFGSQALRTKGARVELKEDGFGCSTRVVWVYAAVGDVEDEGD